MTARKSQHAEHSKWQQLGAATAAVTGAEASTTRPKPSRSKPSGPPPMTPSQAAAPSSDNPPQASTVQSAGAGKRSNDTPEDGAMLKSKARPSSPAPAATAKGGDAAKRANDTPEDGATSKAKAMPSIARRLPHYQPTPPPNSPRQVTWRHPRQSEIGRCTWRQSGTGGRTLLEGPAATLTTVRRLPSPRTRK